MHVTKYCPLTADFRVVVKEIDLDLPLFLCFQYHFELYVRRPSEELSVFVQPNLKLRHHLDIRTRKDPNCILMIRTWHLIYSIGEIWVGPLIFVLPSDFSPVGSLIITFSASDAQIRVTLPGNDLLQ